MTIYRISDDLAYADQPTIRELRNINQRHFRTLVNARHSDEQLIEEEMEARRAGLHYVAIPVAQREWSVAQFEALDAALRRPRALPVLVHSAEGARAGILALTWHAHRAGWSLDELEARCQDLGLDLPDAARAWLTRAPAAATV